MVVHKFQETIQVLDSGILLHHFIQSGNELKYEIKQIVHTKTLELGSLCRELHKPLLKGRKPFKTL